MVKSDSARKLDTSNNSKCVIIFSALLLLLVVGFGSSPYYFLSLFRIYARRLTHPPYNYNTPGAARRLADGRTEYDLIVVTDLDHDSKLKDGKTWQSILLKGILRVAPNYERMEVEWDGKERLLRSQFAMGGRAMELSDLAFFDGHVLSVDDRTGIVYKIVNDREIIPWIFLNDGSGNTAKGFKGEWMAVRDELLYVGGLGKEWTTPEGVFLNHNPMYVKIVTPSGEITHVNWVENYKALRRAANITAPGGYMIFESAQWSEIHQRWFFLPRRVSNETYSETSDEFQGSNLMLVADDHFANVEVREVGGPRGDGSRGFSAFQFLPGSADRVIVALKSQERDGVAVATFITAFDVHTGRTLLDETAISGEPHKFEGLLFV